MTFFDRVTTLDPQTRYRVVFEVRDDAGNWADFSTIHWETVGGYGDCLVDLPSFGWQVDRRKGEYADSIGTILVRNDRFQADSAGLWNQALSRTTALTINGYPFTGWARRLVRMSLESVRVGAAGASTTVLGVYEIVNIKRRADHVADIQVRSLFDRLKQRDPATIRDGGSWYRGRSMAFLLRRLLASSLPEGVSYSLPTAFELPPFPSPHTSSMGQTPGTLASGVIAPVKWTVRCMCTDPDDADIVYFGFEVYGLRDKTEGAIARYDLTTRLWTILASGDTDQRLEEWVPRWIRVMDYSGTSRLVTMCSTEGYLGAKDSAHWYLRRSIWNKSTGAHVATDGTASWHPCREVLREGFDITFVVGSTRAGVTGMGQQRDSGGSLLSPEWYGDPCVFGIPQMGGNKGPYLNGYTDPDDYYLDEIEGSYSTTSGTTTTTQATWSDVENRRYHSIEATATGLGLMIAETGPAVPPLPVGHRYFMSDVWAGVPVLREDYLWWVGKNDGTHDFSLKRLDLATGTVTEYDMHGLGAVGTMFWDRWVTAFASAGGQSGSTIRFFVACTTWQGSGSTARWASQVLYLGIVVGSSLSLTTSLLTESPTGSAPAKARYIVGIHTFEDNLDDPDGDTGQVVICVVIDAVRTGGQAFGLYVGESPSTGIVTWYQRFGETGYKGPTSSLPFSGFVEDPAVRTGSFRAFHFVDQASGLIWRLECNLTANTCTYQPVNAGDPISPETHLAADRGLYTTDSNGVIRTLWACAPDSAGDIRNGYWQRDGNNPAANIYVPGIYPLVQYSLEQSDVVDVADFADYRDKSLAAVRDLLALAPGYSMGWVPGAGSMVLTIAKRAEAADSSIVLLDEAEVGLVAVDPSAVYLPLYEITAELDWRDTYASVVVVPHAFQARGEPQERSLAGVGSTFAGRWIFAANTDRAIDVSIRSVASWVAGDTQRAPLLRWQILDETVFLYLAQAAAASATTIYVGGITQEAGVYYAGSVRIRETGVLQVLDGPEVSYTIAGPASGWGGIQLTLGAAIGVDASQYAQVELSTNRQDAVSDGPTGIGIVQGLMGATSFPISDPIQVRRGMALMIDSEIMLVTKVAGDTVYVDRAQFGTTLANHDAGSVVRAYVCPLVPGKLYPVGNTGLEVGYLMDDEEGAGREEHQVSPGDGIRITTQGYSLQPMEHARRRVVSSACLTDMNGEKDLVIDGNRFVDFGKSLPLAEDTLADVCEPRQILTGWCPIYSGLSPFSRVTMRSRRWHFGSNDEFEYEVLSAKYDVRQKRIAVTLRSIDPIPGSGFSAAAPGSVGGVGSVIGSGKRRRR